MESRTGKLAITAALIGLIVAATIVMGWCRTAPPTSGPAPIVADKAASDKLSAELDRCNRLGPGDKPDQACLDAWAQAQRHFLGNRP